MRNTIHRDIDDTFLYVDSYGSIYRLLPSGDRAIPLTIVVLERQFKYVTDDDICSKLAGWLHSSHPVGAPPSTPPSAPDTFVFPQDTPNGLAGKARAGGLTKLELFTVLIYCARLVARGYDRHDFTAKERAQQMLDDLKG